MIKIYFLLLKAFYSFYSGMVALVDVSMAVYKQKEKA